MTTLCAVALSFAVAAHPQVQGIAGEAPHPGPMKAGAATKGFIASNDYETLAVTVCGASAIHVVATPAGMEAAGEKAPWLLKETESCPGAEFGFAVKGNEATLKTSELMVVLALREGALSFKTARGEPVLEENDRLPRTYMPSPNPGLYHVKERFQADTSEAVYGLGQHQSGIFDYRGSVVELAQNNTDIAIPLLVSTRGYGIFWNTASFSYMDNRFPRDMNFEAIAGRQVDYFFLYGPEPDRILHEYRSLTGHTPLFPEWAYGLWQSKDRYKSQTEILDVAAQYRARHIPMDAIVQDWFWWKDDAKGDPQFNENFTDVPGELKTLHEEHVHAMLSVWAMMDPGSKNLQEIIKRGCELPGAHVYDATNPEARKFYWDNLVGKLFGQGWDGFWLDSSEPEEYWPHWGDATLTYRQTHMGSGAEYTNIYPLEHTEGVSEHWRETNPEKRVFLLTRSAFAGQQRNGAAVWSGDVYQSWWALRRQIPAGMNIALSGYPYWTTDIGGYEPVSEGSFNRPEYQELYERWFEYGVFCPIFRTHGHRDHNELWGYDRVFPALLTMDKLRYRLLPYVYSLAWKVTAEDYTIQRPLVMDFRGDRATWEIGDEFMFGPALLVSPVVREGARSRVVYFPAGSKWYDFWSGKRQEGGVEVSTDAPEDRIPLAVRAGSILPMGPEIEYAGEANDPIELRIYPGADAEFDLYEDEGDSYRYEQGARSVIALAWDDAGRRLTIGERQGSFAGMPAGHRFNVVLVDERHGTGPGVTARPDKAITYEGKRIVAQF